MRFLHCKVAEKMNASTGGKGKQTVSDGKFEV